MLSRDDYLEKMEQLKLIAREFSENDVFEIDYDCLKIEMRPHLKDSHPYHHRKIKKAIRISEKIRLAINDWIVEFGSFNYNNIDDKKFRRSIRYTHAKLVKLVKNRHKYEGFTHLIHDVPVLEKIYWMLYRTWKYT